MIKQYSQMTLQERQAEYAAVKAAYEQQKALGLKLNMARGKPGREQLDLVMDIAGIMLKPEDFITDDGIETRNYGERIVPTTFSSALVPVAMASVTAAQMATTSAMIRMVLSRPVQNFFFTPPAPPFPSECARRTRAASGTAGTAAGP